MHDPIVHSASPVTLVGGGQATQTELHKALTLAPICVAADGGAALALAAEAEIAAVIGDFDSITPDVRVQVPQDRQHRIPEQTSTDFDKALTRISAPVVIGVGFLGGRADHQLAVLHSLLAHPQRPCVLLGAQEVICLAPPKISLPTEQGDVVSLFPMAPITGRSTGLHWPIEGLAFSPKARIGTSNIATGPTTLDMDGPEMLLILPQKLMPALVAQLAADAAPRWPARA